VADRPLILGHRGAPREVPENTLASFRRALEAGADGVELDVHLAADGEAVVVHDPDLARTAGSSEIVAESTAAQLAALDLGAGEGVPGLVGVAEWAATSGAWLNVELKAAEGELVHIAVACLRDAGVLDRTILSSFHPHSVAAARESAPGAAAYLLTEQWNATVRRSVAAVGASGVCLADAAATPSALAELADLSLPTIIWTVDSAARMRALLRARVAGLITNLPGRGASLREGFHS
jgi:glycerophosphoryl diester phosphodiesterase